MTSFVAALVLTALTLALAGIAAAFFFVGLPTPVLVVLGPFFVMLPVAVGAMAVSCWRDVLN